MASDSLVTTIQSPQHFYEINSANRFDAICRVMDEYQGKVVLIFCRTKKDVDHIADKMQLLNYNVIGYHGDLTPAARSKSFKSFINGQYQAILLTDLPTVFDELKHIDLVLFSAVPQDPDSYIQRILRLESELKVGEVATLIHSSEFKKIAFIKRVTKSEINEKPFLDVDEIIEQKKAALLESFDVYLDSDIKTSDIIDQLSNDLISKCEPSQVISFLLTKGFYRDFVKQSYSNLSSTKKNKNVSTKLEDLGNNERLFIAIGKADGINEETLVEFLVKETNIPNDVFSQVKLFDTFSFFVVPNEEAEIVLEIFRRKKRGKRSIVERAKGKDSKKKN